MKIKCFCWKIQIKTPQPATWTTHPSIIWTYQPNGSAFHLCVENFWERSFNVRTDTSSTMLSTATQRWNVKVAVTNNSKALVSDVQESQEKASVLCDSTSLTARLTKRDPERFREIVNICTERRAEKRIQQTAWILIHVLRKTLCEHVNGLCPAGWLNQQSITKHWFQSVRTCPYSWATGRNSSMSCWARHATNYYSIRVRATRCDSRPECWKMEDECESQCDPRPWFCDDECGKMSRKWINGNRACDGYINRVILGSDKCSREVEENCSMRFPCKSKDRVSIDRKSVV